MDMSSKVIAAREAIALLRGGQDGIDRWNQLRKQASVPQDLDGSDFSGCDLSGAVLKRLSLRGCLFRGANLHRVDLSQANAENADFEGAWLDGTVLTEVVARCACFAHVNSVGLRAARSDMQRAILDDACLHEIDLDRAVLSYASGRGAIIIEGTARAADLRGCSLVNAFIQRLDASDANLEGCDLSQARLMTVDLSGARLTGVVLSDTELASDTRDTITETVVPILPEGAFRDAKE